MRGVRWVGTGATGRSLLPVLQSLRTAKDSHSFLAASSDVLEFKHIPEPVFIQVMHALALCYRASGYHNTSALEHMVTLLKETQNLHIFTRISALESLLKITPYSNPQVFHELINDIAERLHASSLHELTVDTCGQLLMLCSNLRCRDERLMDKVKSLVLTSALPVGLMNGVFVCKVLQACSQLNFGLGELETVLLKAVTLNAAKLTDHQAVYVPFCLSKMGLFPMDLWESTLIPRLSRVETNRIPESVKVQIHYTTLAIDFFGPIELKQLFSDPNSGLTQLKRTGYHSAMSLSKKPKKTDLSSLHSDLAQVCDSLNLQYRLESLTPSPTFLTIDLLLQTGEAMEVQGPSHYILDSMDTVGSTAFKNKLLRRLGYTVIEVPYYLWYRFNHDEKVAFLKERVKSS